MRLTDGVLETLVSKCGMLVVLAICAVSRTMRLPTQSASM